MRPENVAAHLRELQDINKELNWIFDNAEPLHSWTPEDKKDLAERALRFGQSRLGIADLNLYTKFARFNDGRLGQ